MKNKNEEVMKLVEEFGKVYEKFCKLEKEVEVEFDYWNDEKNWKNGVDEEYSMRLYVMKNCLEDKS